MNEDSNLQLDGCEVILGGLQVDDEVDDGDQEKDGADTHPGTLAIREMLRLDIFLLLAQSAHISAQMCFASHFHRWHG